MESWFPLNLATKQLGDIATNEVQPFRNSRTCPLKKRQLISLQDKNTHIQNWVEGEVQQQKSHLLLIWVFPKIGVFTPQNGWWFIMENPYKKWMIWGEAPDPYFWVDTHRPRHVTCSQLSFFLPSSCTQDPQGSQLCGGRHGSGPGRGLYKPTQLG